MPSVAKVLKPTEVIGRLSELGLTLEILSNVARHYGITVASATEDHPSWGRGITPASEAVFALRQQTRPHGWDRSEERGFALTLHPNNLLAINIAKGDENTGNPERSPQSSAAKGVCTEEAVLSNQLSFEFIEDSLPVVKQTERRPTWYLILRVSGGKVLSELSLPVAMSDEGHIAFWAERIILPTVDISEPEKLGSREDVQIVTPIVGRRDTK